MAFIRDYGLMGDPWNRSEYPYAGGFFSKLTKKLKPPKALRKLTLGKVMSAATPLLPLIPGIGTAAAAGIAGLEHLSSGGRRVLQALAPEVEPEPTYQPTRVVNADVEFQPAAPAYVTTVREAETYEPELEPAEDVAPDEEPEELVPEIETEEEE